MSTGRSRGRARVRTGAEPVSVGGIIEGVAAASLGEDLPQPPAIPPPLTTTSALPTGPATTAVPQTRTVFLDYLI